MASVVLMLKADLPIGVSIADWKEYVLMEVRAGVGAKNPKDPLFHLNRDSVKVTGTIVNNAPVPLGEPF